MNAPTCDLATRHCKPCEGGVALLTTEEAERLLKTLDGWAKGARSAGTWFGMHHRALVGRVAILAAEKWDDEVLRVTDVFKTATVRRFPPSERTAALEWVREV